MTPRHVDRLRRARDLLYSAAGFDSGLLELARADPFVQLVSIQDLYHPAGA